MKAREIFEKLYEQAGFEYDHQDIHPDRIKEALSTLRKEIEALMKPIKQNDDDFDNGYDTGFNSAIDAVIERLF